jgi:hypothetical protein
MSRDVLFGESNVDVSTVDATTQSWSLRETVPRMVQHPEFRLVATEFRSRNETRPMEFLFRIHRGSVTIAEKAPETADRVPVWRPPNVPPVP